MTRQNRVNPSGQLIADPSKAGLLMGNRGCLHDNTGKVVRERASTKRWIACTTEPKYERRTLMQPGSYTELFFLDEATAIAAGHRPCAQCRADIYKLFSNAWLKAGLSGAVSADIIDNALDAERRNTEKTLVSPASLPDGAMVRHPDDGSFHLVYEQHLYPWSFSGYGSPTPLTAASEHFELVTHPSTVKVLEAGYKPKIHDSLVGSHQG